jgi:hypothetical protein
MPPKNEIVSLTELSDWSQKCTKLLKLLKNKLIYDVNLVELQLC